ncbi:pyridoxamine 5'-phosphate oxidase-domain-containing protein [Gaertneriomyces semiglobifer]|nr:pyridoxamine 5'-phosphate oxidase-domain-containing protein [Gaertneriomyces semiglobifer]
MTLPWRKLLEEGLEKSKGYATANWPTLATLTRDPQSGQAKPAARIIAFRGFTSDCNLPYFQTHGDWLVFTTDARSAKIRDLLDSDGCAELCWYLPEPREQYRLTGTMHVVLPSADPTVSAATSAGPEWEELRMHHFRQISSHTRAQFTWPSPKVPSVVPREAWTAGLTLHAEEGKDAGAQYKSMEDALTNFALLVFETRSVDRLELGEWPSRRTLFHMDGEEWIATEVNP